jgi:hypothetical protein
MTSNTNRGLIYYLLLTVPIALAAALGALVLLARSGAEGSHIPTDSMGASPISG